MAWILSPLWRWKWLLLACLVVTIGYSLFSLPAQESSDPFGSAEFGQGLTHGWPWAYLKRSVSASDFGGRWSIASHVDSLSPRLLVSNLALAIGISLLLTYAVAGRFAYAKLWQFGLKDVIGITLVISMLLGATTNLENAHRENEKYLAELEKQGCITHSHVSSPCYLLPLRDLGLLSEKALHLHSMTWYDPIVRSAFQNSRENGTRSLDLNQLMSRELKNDRRLRYPLDSLSIYDPSLDDQGVDALIRWVPSCESLEISGDSWLTDQTLAKIAEAWPALKELDIGSPNLTKKSLESLRKLQQLEFVRISACAPYVSPDELRFVDDLPRLQSLEIPKFLFEQVSPEKRRDWESRGIDISESYILNLELIIDP